MGNLLTQGFCSEDDMLDLAALLKDNSRLGRAPRPLLTCVCPSNRLSYTTTHGCAGCQIILNKELEGVVLTLPEHTRNFYVDGHVPTPH